MFTIFFVFKDFRIVYFAFLFSFSLSLPPHYFLVPFCFSLSFFYSLIYRFFVPFCTLLLGFLPNNNPFLVMKQINCWIVLVYCFAVIAFCQCLLWCICIVIFFCICIASIRNVNIKRFIISKSVLGYFFSWLSFSGKITVCFFSSMGFS